jgi:2-keto-4-pentenoate hydratase
MMDEFPAYLRPLLSALIDARRRHASIPLSGLPVPRSDADAYAVQRAVAHALGWFANARPPAWKVGAASRDATPNAAPLPAAGIRESPATFVAGTFNRILVEGEIAFRLRAPLDAAPDVDAARAVAAAVDEWLVTIEIVDPRYDDLDATAAALRLADQGLHGALVVGTGRRFPQAVDWASLVALVRRNGDIVRQTHGGHPLGDLAFLLPWLARHAEANGMPLAAGDIVTAGTWTGVVEAFPGETIDVEFPAIGRASVHFE